MLYMVRCFMVVTIQNDCGKHCDRGHSQDSFYELMLRVMNDMRHYLVGLDTLVPTRHGRRPYINFDNAASTPPFKSVLQAINDCAPWYASVHRGDGLKSRLSTDLYEEARQIVAAFVGAHPEEHVVVFGKNTTEAINKLSYRLRLRRDDIVLISHLEHHSNDLPWRAQATVKRIGLTPDGEIDKHNFVALLRRYKGRVKLVAVSGASNVTGNVPDVHWYARQAHAAGVPILVDCAQLAAHRPIVMGRLHDPEHLDYVAISGHKLYAPFGTGALIGRHDTFTRGEPEYQGGGTVRLVTAKTVDWAEPPEVDEAGSPNVLGAIALARAIRTLERIGFRTITAHEAQLTSYALSRLKTIPEVTVYGDTSPVSVGHRTGVIPFTVDGLSAQLVAAILGDEHGIGVRSGCFCAQPYVMSLLGLHNSEVARSRYHALHRRRDLLPGMVRISLGLYNTTHEVELFIEALRAIAQGNHENYTVDRATGMYTPTHTSYDRRQYFKI